MMLPMEGLLKLVTVGILCGILLSLSGKGPLREVLRFGCACLTVVVLLSVLRHTDSSTAVFSGFEGQLQTQLEQTQTETRQAVLQQATQLLEAELQRQAAAYSLNCTVAVSCRADPAGNVTVEGAEVLYHSGPREKLRLLRQAIAAQLAIPTERIIVKEEYS